MKQIDLEIFFHNDTTSTFKDIGIQYDLSDCEKRVMTFYNINAISPYIDGGNEYCSIHSNGSEFICNATYSVVRNLLIETLK